MPIPTIQQCQAAIRRVCGPYTRLEQMQWTPPTRWGVISDAREVPEVVATAPTYLEATVRALVAHEGDVVEVFRAVRDACDG